MSLAEFLKTKIVATGDAAYKIISATEVRVFIILFFHLSVIDMRSAVR